MIDQLLANIHVSKRFYIEYIWITVHLNQWLGGDGDGALTLQTASRGGDDPPHPRPLEINFHYHVSRGMDTLPGFDSPTLDRYT